MELFGIHKQIADILFRHYPLLQKAYHISRELAEIYTHTKEKGVAFTRLAQWYDKVEKAGFKTFNTVIKTLKNHYITILNYFDHRSTNAQQNHLMLRSKLSEVSSEG